MKFIKKALILSSAVLSIHTLNVLAGGPEAYPPPFPIAPVFLPTFFVGGDVGYGRVDQFNRSCSWGKGAGAFNIKGGYQFHPNFAVQGGFNQIFNRDNDLARNNYSYYLAGKAILPFYNRWNIYDALGVAEVHSTNPNNNGTRTSLYYGAGLGYLLGPNVMLDGGISGTIERGSFAVPNMFMFTGGISILF